MKNDKISSFQLAVIGLLMSTALFEGVASVFIIASSQQNSVITASISLIIGLIPLFLIIYIINFQPEKDIIDKICYLFGKTLGSIINFILSLCFLAFLTITLWNLVNFAEIKYLAETPPIFIGIMFLIPVIYTSIKGIEAIARSSEILLYIFLFFHIFANTSLLGYIELNNLLPVLEKGITPILKSSIHFLVYTIPPFLLLTIVPKNMITNNQKLTRNIVIGYLVAMIVMIVALFTILTTVGPYLAVLYRFPSYYVMKKIQLSGFFENLENILSIFWIINMYILICMSTYYISKYINKFFKKQKNNYNSIIIIIICVIALYIKGTIFKSSVIGIYIAQNIFPFIIGLPLFIIILAICLKIFYDKILTKIQKNSNYN
ncbi:MAG: endospore germination permease [Mollicutes bacterium]|nr:endospore germination permease [Mollicutes bacterium]